jgi:hypothetical protein
MGKFDLGIVVESVAIVFMSFVPTSMNPSLLPPTVRAFFALETLPNPKF